jgi:CubicO group peptidase (beta-lactamase class C family)
MIGFGCRPTFPALRCSRALRYLESSKDIRADYQYCNLRYVAAGMVAERISGQTWEDFTQERIMKPLGMVHTGFSDGDLERAPESARPYIVHDQEKAGEIRAPARAALADRRYAGGRYQCLRV